MSQRLKLKPGDRFNYLTVVKFHHSKKHRGKYYLFECDCGNQNVVSGSCVVNGYTKSCGCLRRTNQWRLLPNNRGLINQIIWDYKRRAEQKGFLWALTYNDAQSLISQSCYYCGRPPSNIKQQNTRKFAYSGIDRLDSCGGYTIGNVVPCCWECNRAKGGFSKDGFLQWIKSVYNYRIQSSFDTETTMWYI